MVLDDSSSKKFMIKIAFATLENLNSGLLQRRVPGWHQVR
jgi:hypothetical protein